jgi:hypothetical protein
MKHVNSFQTFLNESMGISRPIYAPLEQYFKEHAKDASFEEAKKYVALKVKDWKLSPEDYKEAEKKFQKSGKFYLNQDR